MSLNRIQPRWDLLRVNRMEPRKGPPPTAAEILIYIYLPMWLVAGGIAIELIEAFFGKFRYSVNLAHAIGEIAIGTGLVLAGVLVGRRIREFPIGRPRDATIRIAAIAVATVALKDLAAPLLLKLPTVVLLSGSPRPILAIPTGPMSEIILQFCICYTLLGVFFELDDSDASYCASIMFVLGVAAYFLPILV